MPTPRRTRDKLLEKATLEFARFGTKAVGVDQLCKVAEINKGSFYHYFTSKQALIAACLDAEWDTLRKNLLEPAFAYEIAPLQRIDAYFQIAQDLQIAFHKSYNIYPGCLMCTLGSELALDDESISNKIKEYFRRNTAYFYTAFRDAFDERSVKEDPSKLAEQVSLLTSAAFLQVRILQELWPLELANDLSKRFAS